MNCLLRSLLRPLVNVGLNSHLNKSLHNGRWRSMQTMRPIALTSLAVAFLAVVAGAARAGEELVTACSRYGNGCYSAPVRAGKFGPEMRLKGGTWIDCRGDCRTTLREETVDFWETQQEKAMVVSPR